MKKVLTILVLALGMVGCTRSPIVGKWTNGGYENAPTVEFKSNGTYDKCYLAANGLFHETGKYRIEQGNLMTKRGSSYFDSDANKKANWSDTELEQRASFTIAKDPMSREGKEQLSIMGGDLSGIYTRAN